MTVKIFKILRSIVSHPAVVNNKFKAVVRYVSWQIISRSKIEDYIFRWIEEARLKMRKSEAMVTHNFYTGLYEFEEFLFLMRYSGSEEILFDIGANAGVYTVLGAKVLNFEVVSFEPVRSTFERLEGNISINGISDQVVSKNIGLSDKAGKLAFTKSFDATNHVVLDQGEFELKTEEVHVSTLDDEVEKLGRCPTILKIDVEGYEYNVLKGGRKTLESNDLRVVLIELNNSGLKYGFDDQKISHFLGSMGFKPFDFDYGTNDIIELPSYKSNRQNTIFIRDMVEVREKLNQSSKLFYSHILERCI